MTSSSETPNEPQPESAKPHDLAGLPAPRRPWRRVTLVTLALGALVSLALAFAVLPDVVYSLHGGSPRDLGDLVSARLDPGLADVWVHGEGQLSVTRAIRYARPLEHDTYRLASVE